MHPLKQMHLACQPLLLIRALPAHCLRRLMVKTPPSHFSNLDLTRIGPGGDLGSSPSAGSCACCISSMAIQLVGDRSSDLRFGLVNLAFAVFHQVVVGAIAICRGSALHCFAHTRFALCTYTARPTNPQTMCTHEATASAIARECNSNIVPSMATRAAATRSSNQKRSKIKTHPLCGGDHGTQTMQSTQICIRFDCRCMSRLMFS